MRDTYFFQNLNFLYVRVSRQPKEYTMGVCFSLAHDYGFMRIMSSYYFDNSDQGPPGSSYGGTDDVPINGDGTCGGGWVCEHRWNAITQMVSRNVSKRVRVSKGMKMSQSTC